MTSAMSVHKVQSHPAAKSSRLKSPVNKNTVDDYNGPQQTNCQLPILNISCKENPVHDHNHPEQTNCQIIMLKIACREQAGA